MDDNIEELLTTIGAAIGAWLAMKIYKRLSTELQVWYHMRHLEDSDSWMGD
jgi:uncharacterized membrane protein required for colicin V production